MAKKRRMGRNLESLLGGAARERNSTPIEESSEPEQTDQAKASEQGLVPSEPDSAATLTSDSSGEPASATEPSAEKSVAAATPQGDQLVLIDIEKIRRGTYQPRRLFDPELLQELSESIKSEGMIQPIIVREFADGYELVAGERRWRAAQMAGMDRLPAIVRDMQDQSVAAVALIENIQRKDLNPLEEAAAFERLCDEFGMTHKAVAESVGRSRAAVSNLLRLLELNDEVKLLVDRGELEMGHARALLAVAKARQLDVAQKIIQQGMSVRSVEKYIRSINADDDESKAEPRKPQTDPDIERLSKKLSETLGAAVSIQHRNSGGGKLQITYSSVSELQGILAHIK